MKAQDERLPVDSLTGTCHALNCCDTVALQSPSLALDVGPTIETFSLRFRQGTNIDVRGSTSARGGLVHALTTEGWKAIADVQSDGTFSNPNLPESYLTAHNTLTIRVEHNGTSHPVTATNHFVHSRSLSIYPTATKPQDQQFYQWRLQWADYQPTGYWIPAQTRVPIWLEGDDQQVTAYIGTQGLAEMNDRSRQTENMRAISLKRGENLLPLDPGGALHISNNGRSACRVIIGPEATPLAFFRLHHTDPADWYQMLERSQRLPVQLVGDRVAITCHTDTYRRHAHADVGEIVRSHEEVLSIEAQAAGLDGSAPLHTRSTMWIHAVEAASSLPPHATTGYIGLPHASAPGNPYMEALVGGVAHNRWVTLHEYGHHFQNRTNTVSPQFDENTVNIYSLAVHRLHRNEYTDVFPTRWPALQAWLARPRPQKNYMESPDTQAIFEQLRLEFGPNFLINWDRYAREHPSANNDLTNFATSLSRVAGRNLAHFFADWGVIRENDAVWQALHALSLPHAPDSLTRRMPYT
jgi:hypothetical protein